ncbi:lymphotactin isoform 1-T5 [Hipposideros larvatus]
MLVLLKLAMLQCSISRRLWKGTSEGQRSMVNAEVSQRPMMTCASGQCHPDSSCWVETNSKSGHTEDARDVCSPGENQEWTAVPRSWDFSRFLNTGTFLQGLWPPENDLFSCQTRRIHREAQEDALRSARASMMHEAQDPRGHLPHSTPRHTPHLLRQPSLLENHALSAFNLLPQLPSQKGPENKAQPRGAWGVQAFPGLPHGWHP